MFPEKTQALLTQKIQTAENHVVVADIVPAVGASAEKQLEESNSDSLPAKQDDVVVRQELEADWMAAVRWYETVAYIEQSELKKALDALKISPVNIAEFDSYNDETKIALVSLSRFPAKKSKAVKKAANKILKLLIEALESGELTKLDAAKKVITDLANLLPSHVKFEANKLLVKLCRQIVENCIINISFITSSSEETASNDRSDEAVVEEPIVSDLSYEAEERLQALNKLFCPEEVVLCLMPTKANEELQERRIYITISADNRRLFYQAKGMLTPVEFTLKMCEEAEVWDFSQIQSTIVHNTNGELVSPKPNNLHPTLKAAFLKVLSKQKHISADEELYVEINALNLKLEPAQASDAAVIYEKLWLLLVRMFHDYVAYIGGSNEQITQDFLKIKNVVFGLQQGKFDNLAEYKRLLKVFYSPGYIVEYQPGDTGHPYTPAFHKFHSFMSRIFILQEEHLDSLLGVSPQPKRVPVEHKQSLLRGVLSRINQFKPPETGEWADKFKKNATFFLDAVAVASKGAAVVTVEDSSADMPQLVQTDEDAGKKVGDSTPPLAARSEVVALRVTEGLGALNKFASTLFQNKNATAEEAGSSSKKEGFSVSTWWTDSKPRVS